MLTQERLKELLSYDEETGSFVWLKTNHKGKVAGCTEKDGYRVIAVDRRQYFAHRLAWLYVHGRFPVDGIDHINRIRNDNRIANLREATPYENAQNVGMHPRNSTGYKGVVWHKSYGKFMARTTIKGKRVTVGFFDDAKVAHEAICAAKEAM